MNKKFLYFMPLIYKQGPNLWLPAGQNLQLSCDLDIQGVYGINMAGEEVPLPTTTTPPLAASPGKQSQYVLIAPGGVWLSQTYFSDTSFKICIKVKDRANGNLVSYVDLTSWNTLFPTACNFVPEPGICSIPTNISAGTPGTTTATITYVPEPGSVGVEWINNTSGTTPVIDGTYADASVTSIAITGLSATTAYHFWIRTICGAGSRSAWTSITYTTAS